MCAPRRESGKFLPGSPGVAFGEEFPRTIPETTESELFHQRIEVRSRSFDPQIPEVQAQVVAHMRADKPVGAICHGVLVPARAIDPQTGRSVLHGRKSTALSRAQELSAWAMTGLWLGSYYRTYSVTVQDEVSAALASPEDFIAGPISMRREGPDSSVGHTIRDGNYLSGGYYVDAYRFARDYVAMLAELSAPA